MTICFRGEVAIVTGAASGIGRATALLLAAQGARVLIVDRDEEGSAAVCREAIDAGHDAETLSVDLTSSDAPMTVFDTATKALGAIPSILVNNAGMGNARSALETDDNDWHHWLDVNLTTVFRMSREAIARFESGACIVNVSSVFGLSGFMGAAPYSAAKAGIVGLTRQMAADYGERGIRVNAVAPGLVATPATEERIASNALFRHGIIFGTPLNRLGTPSDIANAISFLSSSQAAFVTGQVLAVDGGWSSTHYRAAESL